MSDLIAVFRMTEIPTDIRCKVIIALGRAINDEYAMNITEALVFHLVSQLDPSHKILNDDHYRSSAEEK